MNPTDKAPFSRRRLAVIIASALTVIVLAGVGIYGLVTGPRTPDSTAPTRAPSPSEPAPTGDGPAELAEIPATNDPRRFAERVADALFTWDTGSGLLPLDYTSVLLDVADPSGVEQSGLASDIAGYFPNREAWIELRKHQTRQWIEITDLYVPEGWAEAEAQAQPGQLVPGAVAYTVEGVRHRDGIWHGETVTAQYEVAFTIFLACPPQGPDDDDEGAADRGEACYLLRLSMLDTPLT